jgi:hypothetical protein
VCFDADSRGEELSDGEGEREGRGNISREIRPGERDVLGVNV